MNRLLDLMGIFLYQIFCNQFLFPIFILAFLACIPILIRYLCFGKR